MTHPLIKSRRRFLQRSMATGMVVTSGAAGWLPGLVHAMGKIPAELIPGKSIYDMRGRVFVDGKQADEDTYISGHSLVETGSNSYVVFVIGKDAHILRENSRVQFQGSSDLEESLRLVTGKLLSVFGKRDEGHKLGVHTSTATIGIRGTGLYTESYDDSSYACTCYGHTEIVANSDASHRESIISHHHDAPRFILRDPDKGKLLIPAPMFDHTDEELMLITQLVGRTPPFATTKTYSSPRKGY